MIKYFYFLNFKKKKGNLNFKKKYLLFTLIKFYDILN